MIRLFLASLIVAPFICVNAARAQSQPSAGTETYQLVSEGEIYENNAPKGFNSETDAAGATKALHAAQFDCTVTKANIVLEQLDTVLATSAKLRDAASNLRDRCALPADGPLFIVHLNIRDSGGANANATIAINLKPDTAAPTPLANIASQDWGRKCGTASLWSSAWKEKQVDPILEPTLVSMLQTRAAGCPGKMTATPTGSAAAKAIADRFGTRAGPASGAPQTARPDDCKDGDHRPACWQ